MKQRLPRILYAAIGLGFFFSLSHADDVISGIESIDISSRFVLNTEDLGEEWRYDLNERGVGIAGEYGGYVLLEIPEQVRESMNSHPVYGPNLRKPHIPIPCVVSEGIALLGADEWHTRGYMGEGVKIAIIDVGFYGLQQAKDSGELPADLDAVDYTGFGMESLSQHGTAVSEIVHDMAPDAELTLINTYSEIDLGNAKDYCIENGIHVVNHSVGYANTGGHDGTGIVCEIADDAADNGILWVNAVGNHAQKHYRGVFTDMDGDSLHEFSETEPAEFNILGNLSEGSPIWVYLSWNSWPETDQDYDFIVYGNNGEWEPVFSSTIRQTGSQPPTEELINYTVPFTGEYGLAVKNHAATGTHEITIVSAYQALRVQTPAGSVLQPADAAGAFAVGAIHSSQWISGPQQPSSSQGPTYDGRLKPELAGPDGVETSTSGPDFTGTSVASPHVAGAAGLIRGAFPDMSVDDLWNCLISHAVDMGPMGPDSLYGWGRIDLPLSISALEHPVSMNSVHILQASPNPFSHRINLRYRMEESGEARVSIFDMSGRVLDSWHVPVPAAGTHTITWNGMNRSEENIPSGSYVIRIRKGTASDQRRVICIR